jgi:hypothetical protein
MVGEDHPGIDVEGRAGGHPTDGLTQRIDLGDQQIELRSSRFTVKKNVPPGTRLRR